MYYTRLMRTNLTFTKHSIAKITVLSLTHKTQLHFTEFSLEYIGTGHKKLTCFNNKLGQVYNMLLTIICFKVKTPTCFDP